MNKLFSQSLISERVNSNPTYKEGTSYFFSDGVAMALGANRVMNTFLKPQTPYLIDDYRCCLVTSGSMSGRINLREYTVGRGSLVCFSSGTFLEPIEISNDFYFKALVLSSDTFHIANAHGTPEIFNGRTKDYIRTLNDVEFSLADELFDLTLRLLQLQQSRRNTKLSIVAALVNHVSDLMIEKSEESTNYVNAATMLFDRFIYLVNANANEQRALKFYANKLCVSERYLGTVIRQVSGQTAKTWIDRAVMTYAKVLLRHEDMSVSSVSDELKFANPSFFCSFFRRIAGCTPQEYRKGETSVG